MYNEITGKDLSLSKAELESMTPEQITEKLAELAQAAYQEREQEFGSETMRRIEQLVLLQTIDNKWMQHLREMDDLREGIGLRAYGQSNPLLEYRFEAYEMFKQMTYFIQEDCLKLLFRVVDR